MRQTSLEIQAWVDVMEGAEIEYEIHRNGREVYLRIDNDELSLGFTGKAFDEWMAKLAEINEKVQVARQQEG
jgi:uncharacterized protein (DUF169 family)